MSPYRHRPILEISVSHGDEPPTVTKGGRYSELPPGIHKLVLATEAVPTQLVTDLVDAVEPVLADLAGNHPNCARALAACVKARRWRA